jgi:uncharacterized protein (TIGR02453 family)
MLAQRTLYFCPMQFSGFRPAALRFLRDLARNNRREWFESHRQVYEAELRQPVLALLDELDVRLGTLAPEIGVDAKRSMFRIHRDVRFSKDKSPYKTHVAFWVSHRALGRSSGSAVHGGAGLYFHIEPKRSLVAAGIWMPPAQPLARIRAALVTDLAGFERARRTFRRQYGDLSEEAILKRVPRGFRADHPAAHWLRYQSFTVSRPFKATDLRRADLPDQLARAYTPVIPFVRWLNAALGLGELRRI